MVSADDAVRRLGIARYLPDAVRQQFVRKFGVALLAAMLVAGGIGAFFYAETTATLDEQVESRVVSTAELQADGLDSWVAGFRRQTRTLSSVKKFQNGLPGPIRDYLLLEASDLTSAFVAVHYVQAADGTVEASTASGIRGEKLGSLGVPWAEDTAHIDNQTDRPGTVYIPERPYESPVTNDTVLAFISSPPQNTEHVVVVEASLTDRSGEFRQAMAGGETTVMGPDGGAVLGGSLAGTDAAAITANGTTENGSGFQQHGDAVLGYATLQQLDWTVVTQVPAASAYALRNQIGTSLLLTLLSALLVLGGVSLAVGHRAAGSLSALSRKADRMRDGDLAVTLDSDRVDEIGQLYDGFDEMRRSLRQQIDDAEQAKERAETAREQAESARAEADDARTAAEALTEQLEARATEYSEVMAACAAGDLTRRMDTDTENEAMRQIATAYNDVMAEWEETIREVRAFAGAVERASGDVSENVSSVRERSRNVEQSATAMADGATRQSDQLHSVSGQLDDLSATVQEMSAAADSVRTRADAALERSQQGRQAATGAADALENIEESTRRAVDEVEELESLTAEIEAVTDLISDIADQTTMLALNANIEAARADAEGDGFAVVAAEVKQLAEETVEATADIESTIQRMRQQVEQTVDEMHTTQRRVSTGSDTVNDALEAFDGIVTEIDEATSGMREIDTATDEQAMATQEVVEMVQAVGDISEETASEAGGVADATAAQVAAVEDTQCEVTELSERAAELGDLLETFTVSGASGDTDTAVYDTTGEDQFSERPDDNDALVSDDEQDPAERETDDPEAETDDPETDGVQDDGGLEPPMVGDGSGDD